MERSQKWRGSIGGGMFWEGEVPNWEEMKNNKGREIMGDSGKQ